MKTFTDERGTIEDLKVGKDWSVTYISFKKGDVRGNHYHNDTTQVATILSGSFLCTTDKGSQQVFKNQIVTHLPPKHPAYLALETSETATM